MASDNVTVLDQAAHGLADSDAADAETIAQPLFVWKLDPDRKLAINYGAAQLRSNNFGERSPRAS